MGDLANMTNVHGEVNGFRLLRWLRSRAQTEDDLAMTFAREGHAAGVGHSVARRNLLQEMADDLERELTPPDYPEDDGDGVDLDDPALTSGPEGE